MCKYGVRSPITNNCVASCPTGLTGAYCDETQPDVSLEFSREGPWANHGVTADHCHPPKIKPNVAAYFPGTDATIAVSGVRPNPVFSLRLWTRVENAGASLFTF